MYVIHSYLGKGPRKINRMLQNCRKKFQLPQPLKFQLLAKNHEACVDELNSFHIHLTPTLI
jgi:hypothetical protein